MNPDQADTVIEPGRSATEVVRAAVVALQAEHWAEVVPLIRPGDLQRHQDTQARWLMEMEGREPRTAEEVRSEQPWLPPEVAAFYAEQERAHLAGSLPALREQWGVTSFHELQDLSPAAFFVRYLSASTPEAKIRASLSASNRPPQEIASVLESARPGHQPRWVVLGEVAEGPDRAHVVYRQTLSFGDGEVRVTTLDRADGQWWLRVEPLLVDREGWSYVWAPEADDRGSPEA